MAIKKKYAIVYQGEFPNPRQGSAATKRVVDIARGLSAAGNAVTLLSPAHFERVQDQSQSPHSFAHLRLGVTNLGPTFRNRMLFWNAVSQWVVENKIDFALFYSTTIDSLQAIYHLRRHRIKVLAEICDLHSQNKHPLLKRLAYRCAETFIPRAASLNVVISAAIQQHVAHVAPAVPNLLIPGMVNLDINSPSLSMEYRLSKNLGSDCILVGYTGTWYSYKGLADFLRAFAQCCRNLPIRAVISGKSGGSKFEDDARHIAQQLGLAEHIDFPGFVSDREVSQIGLASDILIAPSTDHPFNTYAFPTKVAEYASYGKALILTDVGDIGHYFSHRENAYLCPPSNPSELARALVELASSPELRHSLGRGARSTAETHFNYEICGQRIHQAVTYL